MIIASPSLSSLLFFTVSWHNLLVLMMSFYAVVNSFCCCHSQSFVSMNNNSLAFKHCLRKASQWHVLLKELKITLLLTVTHLHHHFLGINILRLREKRESETVLPLIFDLHFRLAFDSSLNGFDRRRNWIAIMIGISIVSSFTSMLPSMFI